MILPIWPANGNKLTLDLSLIYVLPILIQNLCILYQIRNLKFFTNHCLCHLSLGNKLTLDLSRYIWKSLAGETSCCNFFLIANLTWVGPEISKMCNLWGNSLKLGRIRQMRHCLWKNLVWRSGNALLVCFILLMILPIWPANGSWRMCYLYWFLPRTFGFCIEIRWNFSHITVPLSL